MSAPKSHNILTCNSDSNPFSHVLDTIQQPQFHTTIIWIITITSPTTAATFLLTESFKPSNLNTFPSRDMTLRPNPLATRSHSAVSMSECLTWTWRPDTVDLNDKPSGWKRSFPTSWTIIRQTYYGGHLIDISSHEWKSRCFTEVVLEAKAMQIH